MTNKSTKRAFISSVLAIALCFAMLLGTTFAWFTDSATSQGNTVKTGSFGIQLLQYDDAGNSVEITESSAPIFDETTIWAPDTMVVKYFTIKNTGTIPLKFKIALDVYGVTENLNEVMQYAIVKDKTPTNPVTAFENGTDVAVGTNVTAFNDVVLAKGATFDFAVAVHMDENAGNAYDDAQIMFDLVVLAGQNAANAVYPEMSPVYYIPAEVKEDVEIATDVIAVDVPKELVSNLAAEGVTSIKMVHTAPNVNTATNTVTFDAVDFVDQNGAVIDLDANTTKMTVTLPVGDAFAVGSSVEIYHDNVSVATSIVSAEKTVTYEAAHFCEIKMIPYTPVRIPTGNANSAYTSATTIWGEWSGNAIESFVIKIYSGETYLGSTSLNNIGGIIDGDVNVSWHISLDSANDNDEYWIQEWEIAPSTEMLPTTAALFIDGVKVGESKIQFNGPDDLNKLTAAVYDANGNIVRFFEDFAEAFNYAIFNGYNVIALDNVDLNDTLVNPAN